MASFLRLYRKCLVIGSGNPVHHRLLTVGLQNLFNPLNWFAAGEQGAWYDPSDLTTLFQDSAGTTPVTAVEQPVGLMLDKSKGLALGAELVTNGTFDVDISGVTQIGGVGIIRDTSIFTTGGLKLTAIQPGNSGIYAQISIPTVVGATYSLSADLYAPATNSVSLSCFLTATSTAVTEGINISANGVVQRKTCVFSATSTTTLIKAYIMNHGVAYGTTGDVAYYDNISVKQIAGNHAFQATAGNRPVLSARVNLLTKTEDFSDAVWVNAGVTATSDSITSAGSVAYAYKDLGANLPATAYSLSCKVKASTNNFVALNIQGNGTYWATIIFSINPLNPSVGESVVGAGTGITISNTSISLNSDGYFTISAVVTCATSVFRYFGVMFAPLLTGNTFVSYYGEVQGNSVGKTIFTKQADLRPTNAGALLPPYQRVNTASDYDTVGFPLYLKANGTSSAMSTNSIDFSSTDKMTVVTGVRKLSDAAIGTILELSATSASNNGSFTLTAPNSAAANYAWLSKGTTADTLIATTYAAPLNNVLTGLGNISGATNSIRVNGIATSDTNSQGIGNFGNYPLYLFSRNGGAVFLNGNFYGAIIRGAQSDTASVTQTENYMATKTGITF